MATIQQRGEWSQALPLVLLGIRSSLKTDLGHSSAELVYGATLKLPGELLASTPQPECSVQDYASTLKTWMSDLQPAQPRSSSAKVFVSQDLDACSHVFVRVDAVKRPLQQPYDGPFEVIRRTRKSVTIIRNGKHDTITIDRVKPAYFLSTMTIPIPDKVIVPPVVSTPQKKTVSFKFRASLCSSLGKG